MSFKAAFVLCDVKAVAKLEHQRLLVLKIYRTYLNCTKLKKNFIHFLIRTLAKNQFWCVYLIDGVV